MVAYLENKHLCTPLYGRPYITSASVGHGPLHPSEQIPSLIMLLTSFSALKGVTLLTTFISFTATLANAGSLSRRVEKIPYIDYDGIKLAASDAVNRTIHRRDLGDSSAVYAHLAAREQDLQHPSIPKCKKVTKRKEWRQLSYAEKKAYTRAIKCLQTKGDYGISPISDT